MPLEPTKTLEDVSLEGVTGRAMLLISAPGYLTMHPLPDSGEITLGRAPDCHIAIGHPKLSRQHVVFIGGTRPRMRDLGSTNGTTVDGRRLAPGEEVELTTSTRLRIGPLTLMLVQSEADRQSTPRAGAEHVTVSNPSAAGRSGLIAEVARSHVSVLIRGETGVGKEVLAESLHELSGRHGPFLRVNCASLAESLLENELFGHERGAFTGANTAKAGLFEAAAGGTVLLDEIGEMPPSLQAKLLRVIEAREVLRLGGTVPIKLDVRFLAATHRDLRTEVARGAFRADLYFRLNGITLFVPPLRARAHLIGFLAARFADAAAERFGRHEAVRFAPDVMARLLGYSWPGNVRELKSIIERGVLLSRGAELRCEHIQLDSSAAAKLAAEPETSRPMASGTAPPPFVAESVGDSEPTPPALTARELEERARIIAALESCGGNQTRAARMLGVSRATLVHKLDVFRLPRPRK